jgi:hypothetical protein
MRTHIGRARLILVAIPVLVAPTIATAFPVAATERVGEAAEESSKEWKSTMPPPMRPDTPERIEAYGDELPLGSPVLDEKREISEIAPGVTHTAVTRGWADGVYTVDVTFTTEREVADELAHDLTQDRYRTRVERIGREVPDDDESEEPLGWVVRTGSKDSRAEVTALQDLLQTDGYGRGTLRYTGEDGFRTSGPWVVNILEIDPAEFTGTVEPALANGIIPGLATVPATADRHGALAAVNAGFFWVFGADGVAGQITGITMVDGELVSGQERVSPNTEFVDFRSSFLLQPDGDPIADVESLGASLTIAAGDEVAQLDGLNRKPLDGEMVHLTPAFGPITEPAARTEPTTGVEVSVDADGFVTEIRHERGGPIPSDGSVVVGVGSGEDWLVEHVEVGEPLDIDHVVTTVAGEELSNVVTGIVNGGPRLVTDGRTDIQALADGFAATESFFYRWSVNRHPRTIAGISEDGVLFLVTIDGRRPGDSVGASVWEAARVALSLDAQHAVNLDGGGSTTMVIGDEVVTGQPLRATADAILVLP